MGLKAQLTASQRKALRSAAAKKGWDTRIARERREIDAEVERVEGFRAYVNRFPPLIKDCIETKPPPPKKPTTLRRLIILLVSVVALAAWLIWWSGP